MRDFIVALITINEIVLSRAIAIIEAKLEEMEQRLAQIYEKQTETAKAIGETIITASAAYIAERVKDAGADLIEKIRTSVGLDQSKKQSGSRRSGRTILGCRAMTAAFAAGFLAASLWLFGHLDSSDLSLCTRGPERHSSSRNNPSFADASHLELHHGNHRFLFE